MGIRPSDWNLQIELVYDLVEAEHRPETFLVFSTQHLHEVTPMIVLNVFYPNTPGSKFDADYYRDKHMPMVKEELGSACKGISFAHGIGGATPGSKAEYIAIGAVYFDSVDAFQAAFPPHAPKIMSDIPNYTDIEPLIQMSEVKLLDIAAAAVPA